MLRERQFPLAFYGGTFPKWIVSFSLGNLYFAEERNDSCVTLQLIHMVRNGGLGREGIGTSMMMQL